MDTVGERIKHLRSLRNISQVDMATSILVSKSHLSKIESGSANPSHRLLDSICKTYSVRYDWLANGEGSIHNEGTYYVVDSGNTVTDYVLRYLTIAESLGTVCDMDNAIDRLFRNFGALSIIAFFVQKLLSEEINDEVLLEKIKNAFPEYDIFHDKFWASIAGDKKKNAFMDKINKTDFGKALLAFDKSLHDWYESYSESYRLEDELLRFRMYNKKSE